MISRSIILDTGPLVALLNKNDAYYQWTIEQFAGLNPPLLTCEAVISEACFLLRKFENGASGIITLLSRKLLTIPFRLENELSAVSELMNKYRDVPMSLAHACLVRMSEQISDSTILTLDSDFKIYRKHKRQVIPTYIPSDM